MKSSLVHNISVAIQNSIKLLVGIAEILDFAFPSDFKYSYLQRAEKLHLGIFIKPTAEFNLRPDNY